MSRESKKAFAALARKVDRQTRTIHKIIKHIGGEGATPETLNLCDEMFMLLHNGPWAVTTNTPDIQISDYDIEPYGTAMDGYDYAPEGSDIIVVGRGPKPSPIKAEEAVAKHFRSKKDKNA